MYSLSIPLHAKSSGKRMTIILREYPDETDSVKIHNMCVCYCRYCGEYAMILRRGRVFDWIPSMSVGIASDPKARYVACDHCVHLPLC